MGDDLGFLVQGLLNGNTRRLDHGSYAIGSLLLMDELFCKAECPKILDMTAV